MSADLRKQEAPLPAVGAGPRTEKLHLVCAQDALTTEPDAQASLPADEVERIVHSRHNMPFRVLGPHPTEDGRLTVIRAFLPQAERVMLRLLGENADELEMRRLHPDGLFEAQIAQLCEGYEFIVIDASGAPQRFSDAYRFRSFRFSEADERLFVRGRHFRLFEKLGARPATRGGVSGVEFAVWAPNAGRVSVVGDFNDWDGRRHSMQRTAECGIWELFIPDLRPGALYKYEIKRPEGAVFVKADPFAVLTELPPNLASIVDDLGRHVWRDEQWMRNGRAAAVRERGVHSCPWQLPAVLHDHMDEPRVDSLLAEIAAAGYTFVELPAPEGGRKGESPFTFGPPPGDLMAWVDACHRHRLGVLLQDPGAIFPAALSHLAWFDGTQLYERENGGADDALAFDLAKGEVRSVLLSNAVFWLDSYHIDAIRTDSAGAAFLADLLGYVRDRVPGFQLLVRDETVEHTLSAKEVSRIVTGRHTDPFAVLGLQRVAMPANEPSEGEPEEKPQHAHLETAVVRAILPGAVTVHVLPANQPGLVYEMRMIDDTGLFETWMPEAPADYRLRVFEGGRASREIIDPYAIRDFTFGADDQHLFGAGNHYRIYERLGAHPRTVDGVSGVSFAVWAPNAEGVGVVGPFNGWNGLVHQMKRHGVSGVWETFVPGLAAGALYKFEMRSPKGHVILKTDPYAFYTEVPPATASVVYELYGAHTWRDDEWMNKRRAGKPWRQPMTIYEVHLGSWMRGHDDRPLSYREIAAKLVHYVKTLGFTHIELMPIAEYPYEPSWGYQVSNFYAPTSRFGDPGDLMAFVDACHQSGIGVILDWVPGHFPKDAHALAWFDGTHLYEHADPRKGEHPDWGTLIFNYGRHEVENFLIANALFWLENYHFDGLRVDAVASMLYLDYSRPAYGGWIPNVHGGNENLEAIEFLKHTNSILHARFPGILMIAEESTSWPNVSRPAHDGGLGFGFKWNMGWMHDTLAYFSTPPAERKGHHGKLTFSIMYAFSENFILSLSHDEVVHLKRSLLNKMPGEDWEKFANVRLLFTLMYAHPGKKLLFMGGELGQEGEWDHTRGLDWGALKSKANRTLGWFLQDLNRIYRAEGALHEADFQATGFEWLEVDNAEESVLAFLRKARDPRDAVLFAANFSAISRPQHRIGVPYPVSYTELFDSNAQRYGGFGANPSPLVVQAEEIPCHGREFSICLTLPALSAVILKPAPAGLVADVLDRAGD
jgi:1,4-alpha-glucan branching enzyme